MRVVLVTGGARSGKSRWAQERARELGGDRVTVIATAEAGDPEMAARIAAHRAARPARWRTIEAPCSTASALVEAPTEVVVLECLTMLCANELLAGGVAAVEREVIALLEAMASREGTAVVVTNEVGLGVVPADPDGRAFRDALGMANRQLAERAEEVVMVVSGVALRLKG